MRFDLLDEYSTLVPFGLGVSKGNRVIQHPVAAAEQLEDDILVNRERRRNLLSRLIAVLRHVGRRVGYRPIH